MKDVFLLVGCGLEPKVTLELHKFTLNSPRELKGGEKNVINEVSEVNTFTQYVLIKHKYFHGEEPPSEPKVVSM